MSINIKFKLTDEQKKNCEILKSKNEIAFYEILEDFFIMDVVLKDGTVVKEYYDDIRLKRFIWLGDILGFVEIPNQNNIPNIHTVVDSGFLIITGERDTIAEKRFIKTLSNVLGKGWLLLKPEITGEDNNKKLFWWEHTEHYIQHRSDWDTYYEWFCNHLNDSEYVEQFDMRFTEQNQCLSLLRSGNSELAKKRFPLFVEEIKKIA